MSKRLYKRMCGMILTFIMIIMSVFICPLNMSAEKLSDMVVSSNEPVKFEYFNGVDYEEKLSEYNKMGYSTANIDNRIIIPAKQFDFSDANTKFISYKGRENVFLWDENNDKITCTVNVETEGIYTFGFEYYAETKASADIKRSIKIDNEIFYKELSSVKLPRMWIASGKPLKNAAGDEVRPLMKQLEQWQDGVIKDSEGKFSQPLQIYLKKGTHKFEFEYLSMDAYISAFFLDTYVSSKSYNDVKSEWESNGYKASNKSVQFECEDNIVYSTNSTYTMTTDGDPLCSPISRGYAIMNIVSGGSGCGDAITYKFKVEKSGLYKIAFRVRQNTREGLPSYKKIEIDGEVPFAEFEEYCFYNSDYWRTEELSNEDGKAYSVYLKEGEHTLTLTSMLGKFKPMTDIFYSDSQKLSDLLLEIRKITGTDPDYNYDYHLDKQIPYLLSAFDEIEANMKSLMKMINDASKQDTAKYNELKNMIEQLEIIKKDIFKLPRKLKELDTIVSQYSSWITQFSLAPLDMDYIKICSPNENVENKHSNFLQNLYSTIYNFVLSFTKDYDNISSLEKNENSKVIDVWISRGTAWGNAVKNLIDGNFTPKYGINVRMNILPAGQLNAGSVNTLMLAIASGTAPDVCLGVNTASVGEFAIREVLVDLSELDGFEELKKTTYSENYVPNIYNGKVYGIPETMNFSTLIYRKDIFSDIGISVPKTWNEVYNTTIPALLQNNMQFYLPLADGSLYNTLLFQHGGNVYNNDLTASGYGSEEAYDAFVQLCNFVTKYGIPTSASFFNRFRSGEMPIGLGDMSIYMQLAMAAPEIAGRWGIARIPGLERKDGTINYTRSAGSETSVIILNNKDLQLSESWEFVKWWMSTEIQLDFGYTIEAEMGTASRWNSANKEAFYGMAWDKNDLTIIKESFSEIKAVPIVLGGYYTSRYLNTAYNKTAISNADARESLENAVEAINKELERRRNNLRK